MKWMLCCFAGMTTSILGAKLEEEARGRGLDVEVKVFPIAEAESAMDGMQAILLGPHVKYMAEELAKTAGDIPIYIISPQDFGMMNTKKIVDAVLEAIG